jgi:hypothetical protein
MAPGMAAGASSGNAEGTPVQAQTDSWAMILLRLMIWAALIGGIGWLVWRFFIKSKDVAAAKTSNYSLQ